MVPPTPAGNAGHAPDAFEQVRAAGLAVGAGDADQREALGRLAGEQRGEVTGGAHDIVDEDRRQPACGLARRRRAEHRDRACGHGFGRELEAVGARSRSRDEEVAATDASRIDLGARDARGRRQLRRATKAAPLEP